MPTPDALQPTPAELAARVHLVETNAELLMNELRVARRWADQSGATLALVIGLLGQTSEADGGFLVNRIFQELLICAEDPAMASRISSCDQDLIEPQMIRAAAALLTGDISSVLKAALGETATAH